MATLERAIEIAKLAHAGKVDKAGADYVGHPLRVMDKCETEEEKIVGVLHDVVEDSNWTFEMLEAEGFSSEVIEALKCVTKLSKDENYDEFIERVMINELARLVKLYDLKDNMDLSRISEPSDEDLQRVDKYKKAYRLLYEYNPYAIVREEKWTEYKGEIECVFTKSYDRKGRVVGVSEVHYVNGRNVGHCASYVEADGYWYGGFYDEQVGTGGQLCSRKFIEGEVQ